MRIKLRKMCVFAFFVFSFLSRIQAQTMLRSEADMATTTSPKVKIFLSNELRDFLKSKDPDNKAFATGSFGIAYETDKFLFSTMLKLYDTSNPTTDSYGRAVLNPSGNEDASAYLDLGYKFQLFKQDISARGYFKIVNSKWNLSTLDPTLLADIDVTSAIWGLGLYHTLFSKNIENIDSLIASNIYLGVTGRVLSGDVKNQAIKNVLLDYFDRTEELSFLGVELYWDIYFNGIKGFASITHFGNSIDQLGGVRLIVGIGFEVPFLTIDLD